MAYLKISEFARLTGISRKNLIFYAQEGLLSPAYVDPQNNYRYYTLEQVDLASAIIVLRDCGLSLRQIKALLTNRQPTTMRHVFQSEQEVLQQQIDRLSQQRDLLAEREQKINEALVIPQLPYLKFEQHKAMPIFKGPQVSTDDNYWLAFQQFIELCNQRQIVTGIPISSIINFEGVSDYKFRQVDHFFCRLKDSTIANAEIPSGEYLTYYAHAKYAETTEVYQQLLAELNNHHYRINSDIFQEYLIDEVSSVAPEKYVLRLMMKVK